MTALSLPVPVAAGALVGSAAAAGTDADELTGIAGWAVGVMESLGGLGAGLLIALENLFPPIPSEVVLPLAGFTASQGSFTLAGAIAWTTTGSVAGALLLYAIGALFGRDRSRAILAWVPLVSVEDVDKGEKWFIQHGPAAVFFGRMVPLVRSMISLPAGVERMKLWLFVVLTLTGSLIWNTIFVGAGYLLGENWSQVEPYSSALQWLVILGGVVFVAWFVVSKLRERRQPESPVG